MNLILVLAIVAIIFLFVMKSKQNQDPANSINEEPLEDLYRNFNTYCIELFEAENERLKVEFDESKNYDKWEISTLISNAERDIDKTQEWLKLASSKLKELWGGGDTEDQNAINEGYKLIATLISERKGGPLQFDKTDINDLTKEIEKLDKRCQEYCDNRFTFFRPQYGNIVVGEEGSNTINLRIDDAYLKYEAFFGASLSTFCHLLRNVCNSDNGFLSRMILSRSLIEVAIHNLFIIRKLNSIANRIEKVNADKAIEEIELFKNHFLKGMFGTKSPELPDGTPDPYHIFTCLDALKKKDANGITHDDLKEFYEHLCDFTHPNFLMRNVMCEIGPAQGDYFSYQVFIDKSFEGKERAPRIFHYLLTALRYSIELIKVSFDEKEQTRQLLNKKNLENKGQFHYNKTTGTKRE